MTKITKATIKNYIAYLYKKRHDANAPVELLEKWAAVKPEDIGTELLSLYQFWGLDQKTAGEYESTFLLTGTAASTSTASSRTTLPKPTVAPIEQKKANYNGLWILLVLLIAGFGFFLWSKRDSKKDEETDSKPEVSRNTTTPASPRPAKRTQPKPVSPKPAADNSLTEQDNENIQSIHTLLQEEENKNMDAVLEKFSANLQQYYDIYYPTQAQITEEYQKNWDAYPDATNNDIQVLKINSRTFDLFGIYRYNKPETAENKEVPVHDRYEFDDSGKIIKVSKVIKK